MKTKFVWSLVAVVIMSLVGCGGGGGNHSKPKVIVEAPTPLQVKCADLYQLETERQCPTKQAVWTTQIIQSALAAIEVNVGLIERWVDSTTLGAPIVQVDVVNTDSVSQDTWIEVVMDGDCGGGAETPRDQYGLMIMFSKQKRTVAANSTYTFSGSNMCSALELGEHTITARVYDPTGTTVIDFAVMRFTLVE